MTNITIRETNSDDYQAISAILHTTGLARDWFTPELFTKLLMKNKGHYFVATRNQTVLGTIFSSHDGGYFGYIYKLAVLPEYQHEGIGSALLQHVIAAFENIGVNWQFAHINDDNTASLSLLAKHGIIPQKHIIVAMRQG